MTFKIVHYGGDSYIVKYRFRWYHIVYTTLREFPTWNDPHLNQDCYNMGMNQRLFTYADAEAFVTAHSEWSFRSLLEAARKTFDAKQADLMRQWDVNRRKSLKVTK